MRGELSKQLTNVVNDLLDDEEDINTYVCKFSTGVGRWVDTPWAGIRRKDAANSFEEGIYVDYAFNDDFKTLRFSILQGINNASHKQRMDIFKKLIPLIEIPEDFNIEEENPDIHFFRKNYDLENLNEEEMKNDLKLVLDVYKDIIPKYKEITKNNENFIIDGRNIWKIATGEPDITEEAWKEFQEDGFVAIGNWFEDLGHDVDYRIFNSEDEILNKLNETSPNISENTKAPKMIWNFTNEIKVGDIVVASRGVSKCLGIGIITSDYIPPSEVNPNYKMRNIREVDWIINEEIELKGKKFGQDTVHKLSASRWNELIATYCSNHQNIRYNLLKSLFDNFYRDYYEKENIQEEYERLSDEYYESYNEILQKKENGQEYTNEVWLNLISHDNCPYVPYNDSKTHFEQAGFGKNDLDEIAISVFDLVDDLIKSPKEDLTQQKLAIANFNAHEYEGFQDGILSPIFFLIEPYYYIINPRMVDSFNFLRYFIKNENSINKDLTGYIDNNLKLHDLVKSFGEIIPQLGDFVVFNAFSIWLNNKKLGGGYAAGKALPLILQEKNHAISTDERKSVLKNDKLDGGCPMDYGSFYDYLIENGYYFNKETVENYLLSLKVKPFVILTGNSGTGKTKLSQLFAKYISNEKIDNKIIKSSFKIGKSANSRGWGFAREDTFNIFPKIPYEDYFETELFGIPSNVRINFSPRLFFKKTPELKEYLAKLSEEHSDENLNFEMTLPNFYKNNKSEENYEIIPVGANWTENRNIVGYYNVITDEYQSTPAYDLIKYANTDLDNPYFLILDEMNLSHVERYFADFLSAIESGESIPLYGSEEDLEIPSNLFIIGTVNVDETTYMFSPKVLDRANTIEFDTYSAKSYMLGEFNSNAPSGDIKYLENPLLGSEIREMDINQLKDLFKGINSEFWNTLSDEIFKFQEILKKSNFDFGFRVINEIIRFMYVAWVYEGKPNDWKNWNRYFDAQIKQKMLPKLHGSERAIGETLEDLFNACFLEDSGRTFYVETSYKYPQSAKKLKEMKEVLNKQRYVSFIN